MKAIQLIIFLILTASLGFGQDNNTIYLKTNYKRVLYYAELKANEAVVYTLFQQYHNPHTGLRGYSMHQIDTLIKQSNKTFIGKQLSISLENNQYYLSIKSFNNSGKTKKLELETIKNMDEYRHNLNNAYYLNSYFKMYNELNKTYPLCSLNSSNAKRDWDNIPNKYIEHLQFKRLIDSQLSNIKDSIIAQQNNYVKITDYLINNIKTIEYSALKDSIAKLPTDYHNSFRYYETVIKEVAQHQPKYFFRIVEDFPKDEDFIFMVVDNDKPLIQQLNAVEGHNETKQRLKKFIRFGKRMNYMGIASYILVGGLLGWWIF
ncbi:MAG: hypothetical protein MUE85_05945 [Microscillaceae bacterium]|jgi:hypothetical protein|nr:hypothetical protein [Microscillaceae bacterium]